MINEEIERIKDLMNLNENVDLKLRRRSQHIKSVVDSILYDSDYGAMQGFLNSTDDEFEFADDIIDMAAEMISMKDDYDWFSNDDDYLTLRDYIKDEHGLEILEFYYENS
jgi:hypothetical protein